MQTGGQTLLSTVDAVYIYGCLVRRLPKNDAGSVLKSGEDSSEDMMSAEAQSVESAGARMALGHTISPRRFAGRPSQSLAQRPV